MLKCKSDGCSNGICCIECDSQRSQGGQCICETAEELLFDGKEILERCSDAFQD